MKGWGKTGSKEVVPNTFASQYISIILIIFTCIVWAFFSDQGKSASAKKDAVKPVEELRLVEVPLSSEISTVSLETLFTVEGDLNTEAAEIYAVFLSNHDINAEFEVLVPVSSFEKSFRMTRTLDAFFQSKSLPAGAVKIFVLPSQDRPGVRVRLNKGGPA